MKPLIVYSSSTGFTRRYVDWICEAVECDVVSIRDLRYDDFDNRRFVVFASWMQAGKLKDHRLFIKYYPKDPQFELLIVGVGADYLNDAALGRLRTAHENDFSQASFYYLPGGLNFEKMKMFDKFVMKIFSKVTLAQAKKGKVEKELADLMQHSYDLGDRKYTEPIIEQLKKSS